jgi:hypothetical protein
VVGWLSGYPLELTRNHMFFFVSIIVFLLTFIISIGITSWYVDHKKPITKLVEATEIKQLKKIYSIFISTDPLDEVKSIWKISILSITLSLTILCALTFFGAVDAKGDFSYNIYGEVLSRLLKYTTNIKGEMVFWISLFAFVVANKLSFTFIFCLVGESEFFDFTKTVEILVIGLKKSLLVFSTVTAAFSIYAETFFPAEVSKGIAIYIIFIADSVVFLSLLFIPIAHEKINDLMSGTRVKLCFLATCKKINISDSRLINFIKGLLPKGRP